MKIMPRGWIIIIVPVTKHSADKEQSSSTVTYPDFATFPLRLVESCKVREGRCDMPLLMNPERQGNIEQDE